MLILDCKIEDAQSLTTHRLKRPAAKAFSLPTPKSDRQIYWRSKLLFCKIIVFKCFVQLGYLIDFAID